MVILMLKENAYKRAFITWKAKIRQMLSLSHTYGLIGKKVRYKIKIHTL